MIVIHGTKVQRRLRGQATAFCPICRLPAQLSVSSVCRVSHVYYIPLGRGNHVADEARCQQCGTLFGAAPGAMKENPFPATDVESAMQMLPPEAVDGLMGRMEVEERLADGTLSPEERLQLIAEPFLVLEYQFQIGVKGGSRESLIAVAVVLWLAATAAAIILWSDVKSMGRRPHGSMTQWAIACTALAAGLLALTIYLIVTQKRHVASGAMLDRLTSALLPLQPTEVELETVRQLLRTSKSAFAASLRWEELVRRLR